ncbi:endolytic transglycosylase MltG [Bacillus weihaiensis]|uniref:Aminodeoxychorismate lyase n=1 Tax=Bacillus weihaiensis TaxID=1547283 RepID=A0A1L3MPW2_9BACI|nr:endolytic transglycosylase MltG [Bacillus weihaiensis]APH04378.1 hypothetical protein A9C19_06245 [Bacillus weihaiensis]
MSKTGFRAFAAGMIVSTSVLGATYLFSNNQESSSPKEKQEISKDDVEAYLSNNGEIPIKTEEYEQLLAAKNASVQGETKAPETEQKTEEIEKTEETPKAEEPKEEKKEETVTYKVTIKEGMTTSEVSDQLEQNGIIESSGEFDQFLIKNEYHTRVQLGTFEVKKGMTFEQLADAFTR